MAERLNAAVSKTVGPSGLGGSNPPLSASLDRVIMNIENWLRCPDCRQVNLYKEKDSYICKHCGHRLNFENGVIDGLNSFRKNSLIEFYEKVHIKKRRNTTKEKHFVKDINYVEKYYRASRIAELYKQFPLELGYVLDLGGGDGNLLRNIIKITNAKYKGLFLVDFARTQMEIAATRITEKQIFIQGDVLNIPLRDSLFDFVFNTEMIEHLYPKQTDAFLSEVRRIMRPKGMLLITTPNGLELRRMIQEFVLSLYILAKRQDPKDLNIREMHKSRLFKYYIKVTGHSLSNLEDIERAGYVGHFNVISSGKLKKALRRHGLRVNKTLYFIFKPIFFPRSLRRFKFSGKTMFFIEKLAKMIKIERWILSKQMLLCTKE